MGSWAVRMSGSERWILERDAAGETYGRLMKKSRPHLYDQLGKLQPRDITVTTHPRRIATLAEIEPR
jgi:hypothetical protein